MTYDADENQTGCVNHHEACPCRETYFENVELEVDLMHKHFNRTGWIPGRWGDYALELEKRLAVHEGLKTQREILLRRFEGKYND